MMTTRSMQAAEQPRARHVHAAYAPCTITSHAAVRQTLRSLTAVSLWLDSSIKPPLCAMMTILLASQPERIPTPVTLSVHHSCALFQTRVHAAAASNRHETAPSPRQLMVGAPMDCRAQWRGAALPLLRGVQLSQLASPSASCIAFFTSPSASSR
mmetsp:Transcript_34368/g.76317  ORF Transcript_34368/g.76317 Transcript_34368/m.76317 type:complete len:155 (-) Transcript_34368:959-1423(-)